MSDDTLTMLADAAAAFAKPDARRVRALRGSADGYDRATWRQMAELGWLSIQVPEAQGGLGLGLAASATLATRIGYAAFPEPFVSGAVMAPACLAGARADSCGERALASVVAGDCVAALAWQGDAGRLEIDACGVSARAAPAGDILSGSSRFVLPASADAFIVAATGPRGLALYWVPRTTEGLEVRAEPCADGGTSGWLHFTDVALPHDNRLADTGAAELLRHAIDQGTVAVSAELVGLMDRALEMTLDYLRTRKQFGKPIGSFQALQHRAVDIWIQRQLARAVVDASVRTLDSAASTPAARTQAASSAKARASHAALLLCNQAVQLHGAIGFTDEYDLGLYVNRALTLSAWMGNGAEHRRRWGAMSSPLSTSTR
ncbi:MAG: acyl-CoA dehydrogenase family protein [Burkholderiaceae bacterium]|nr:acyl-CoA dehydrogenase family protein [Burkholderiaceae bacterium]